MQVCLWALCPCKWIMKVCHAKGQSQSLPPSWAGTGPVCFLARLCLRGGANEADAVESSDASVQRAVECFRAEARRMEFWKVFFFVFFFQRAKKNEKRIMSERIAAIAALSRSLWRKTVVSTESNFGMKVKGSTSERFLPDWAMLNVSSLQEGPTHRKKLEERRKRWRGE